jgi:hypothetical protein
MKARPGPSSTTLFHADTPDQAARDKMTVQAGPKIQFGGFHDGLRKSRYQGAYRCGPAAYGQYKNDNYVCYDDRNGQ